MSDNMPNHNPNHSRREDIETVLASARFQPDSRFRAQLRAQLRARVHEDRASASVASRLRRVFFTNQPENQEDETRMTMLRPSVVLSGAVLTLMLLVFVGLVIVRPLLPAASPPVPAEMAEGEVAFGEELRLVSYEARQTGSVWTIELLWHVVRQPQTDYSLFIHAVSGDEVIAQADQPLRGDDLLSSYSGAVNLPTSVWEPNRLLRSTHVLRLEEDAPAPDGVYIGLYDPSTGARVPAVTAEGALDEQRVLVWDPTTAQEPPINGYASLSMSADGVWIAVETRPASGDWAAIYLKNRQTGETIYVGEGAWPSLSADGRWLAFVTRPLEGLGENWDRVGSISLFNVESREFRQVTQPIQAIGEPGATMPALSADGSRLVFMMSPRASSAEPSSAGMYDVYLYERETAALTRIAYDFGPGVIYNSFSPSISADGSVIAFMTRPAEPDPNLPAGVFIYRADTETVEHVSEGFFPQISPDGSTVAFLQYSDKGEPDEGSINGIAVNLPTGETRWLGHVLDAGPDGGWYERIFTLSQDGSRIGLWSVLDDPRADWITAPEASGGLGSAYLAQFLFVYDWATDTLVRVDEPYAPHPVGRLSYPALTGDGALMAYLWQSPQRTEYGVFIRDIAAQQTEQVHHDIMN